MPFPRNGNARFDPVIVPKGQGRLEGLSGNFISLYANGTTTGDIHADLAEIYGTEISRDTISRADTVVEDFRGVKNRLG